MAFLQSSIPYFKCWVRREYTHNHEKYHGEFLHAMVIGVTTIQKRCLSFQVIFTGAETYDTDEPNVHGGAMWARMPITALVGDTPFEKWPEPMPVWAAQPWDCASRTHSIYKLENCDPCPWIAKIDGNFYPAKYYFTVDYIIIFGRLAINLSDVVIVSGVVWLLLASRRKKSNKFTHPC